MADPAGCVAKLCTLAGGERQMSTEWIDKRLVDMVPDKAGRDAIIAGFSNGKTKRVYAQTDGNTGTGTIFNEIKAVGTKNVEIGGTWVP